MPILNEKTLKFTREFLVPVHDIYHAWADRSAMLAWWNNLVLNKTEFHVGGSYSLGWKGHPGIKVDGAFKEIVPNEKIVFTWSTEHMHGEDSGVKNSVVTLNFKSTGRSTCELELTHDLFPTQASLDEHYQGWITALLGLETTYNAPQSKQSRAAS